MIHGGWIKLYRQIQENYLWRELPFDRKSAWIDLLLLANHREGHIRVRGIKVDVKRGQVGYSVLTLATRWRWSRGKVTRFLKELQDEHMIEQQNNKLTSLITIVHFDLYQSSDTTNDTTERASNEASDSTTNGQQTDTNKKEKKEKNKSLTFSCEDGTVLSYEGYFEKLWQHYPRKIGKDSALKNFRSSVKTQSDMALIFSALSHYRKLIDGKETEFIKHGSSWFKQWRDFIPSEDN